jgi:hypothetical protein
MTAIQLIFALSQGLLVWFQWCPRQGAAVGIDGSAALVQSPGSGALPKAADHAPAKRDSGEPARDFIVFDATLYKQKPDLTRYGLRPVSMVFKYMMWPAGRDGALLPDRDMVRGVALEVSKSTGIAVLDIEHWPLAGDSAVVEESIGKFKILIQWFKEAAPSVKVGYYGVAPQRNYWDALQPQNSPKYLEWQKSNDRVASIARFADMLFPSVYTFYEDQEGWSKYAVQQIREARRIGGGSPVYIFLWEEYHPSVAKLAGTYLPPDYWRMELELARKYADGVVIWGGWSKTWDESAPWWLETMAFLQRIGASGR